MISLVSWPAGPTIALSTRPHQDAWWILVERGTYPGSIGPSLLVGPYAAEDVAERAMQDSLLIDGFCEEDCTDCLLVGPSTTQSVDYEVEIVDIASEPDEAFFADGDLPGA